MINTVWFSKTKQLLLVTVSCCIVFAALFYLSFVCTLLNPVFYEKIIMEDDMQTCFETVSLMLSANEEPALSAQSVQKNVLSLSEGIIRYIKEYDMSFSDILQEEENTFSISSAVSLDEPVIEKDIYRKFKIHPYMLSYFLSDSNTVFFMLQSIQAAYMAIKYLVPLLSVMVLLIILISRKPAYNIRITVIISCSVLFAASLFLYIFRNLIIVLPLEKVFPGISIILEPFISKAITLLFLRSVGIVLITIPIAVIFSISSVVSFFNKISKPLAVSLVVILGTVFALYHNELFTGAFHKIRILPDRQIADILNQNEEAVHSLAIKLREEATNKPVRNAKLVIYGTDILNKPLWLSASTDINGNARFILPKGSFNVYFDESTLSAGQISFENISISIDQPGSSWYTLHISNDSENQQKTGLKKDY